MAQAGFDVPETVNEGAELGPLLAGADSEPAGDVERHYRLSVAKSGY